MKSVNVPAKITNDNPFVLGQLKEPGEKNLRNTKSYSVLRKYIKATLNAYHDCVARDSDAEAHEDDEEEEGEAGES